MSDIVKGGLVETDGRLMQGDQILSVNGEDVRSATQEATAALLKVPVALTAGPGQQTTQGAQARQAELRYGTEDNVLCVAVLRGAYKNGGREVQGRPLPL